MSYRLSLTNGHEVILDSEDFDTFGRFKWSGLCKDGRVYARRSAPGLGGKQITVLLHRAIMGNPPGVFVDHINGNTLDNRRENLRVASRGQNRVNSKLNKDNASGYTGVMWHRRDKRWIARVTCEGVKHEKGGFSTAEEAASWRQMKAHELHGQFVRGAK